ncbi:MAG: hypothetical protein JWL77_3543 [Chthonomonadaceae bacterium]|nr:hypothetical protein [Chthonomonadaceae bacterium]
MGHFLTTASVMMCPHGGTVTPICANTRVQSTGGFVLRQMDTFLIVGCAFNILGVPHPCIQVQWIVSCLRNQAMQGQVLSDISVGLCVAPDGIPQGPVIITAPSPRVQGL